MYTRNNISQQNYYSSRPEIIPSHFKNAFDQKTINRYIESLKGDGKAIAQFFMRFRAYGSTDLGNKTVANKVGCCTRTVRRWTKKFAQDGFLMKVQKDTYSVNTYHLGITKSTSIAYWANDNKEAAALYNDHGITKKNDGSLSYQFNPTVLPYSSYIYKRNPYPLEKEKKYGLFKKREEKKRVVEAMLHEEQRTWIISHKNQAALKDLLNKDPLKSELFTNDIMEVTRLLELTEREQLKLTAFHDKAIKDLLSVVISLLDRSSGKAVDIKDRVGFAMGRLVKFSKSHNFTVDWEWYFALCEILGIQALKDGELPRPLKFSGHSFGAKMQPKVQNCTTPAYVRMKEAKVDSTFTRTKQEEMVYLEKEIQNTQSLLESTVKNLPREFAQFTIKGLQNKLNSSQESLRLLKEEYEA